MHVGRLALKIRMQENGKEHGHTLMVSYLCAMKDFVFPHLHLQKSFGNLFDSL